MENMTRSQIARRIWLTRAWVRRLMVEAANTSDVGADQWIILNTARNANYSIECLRKRGAAIRRTHASQDAQIAPGEALADALPPSGELRVKRERTHAHALAIKLAWKMRQQRNRAREVSHDRLKHIIEHGRTISRLTDNFAASQREIARLDRRLASTTGLSLAA